jgi:hypothetical protein
MSRTPNNENYIQAALYHSGEKALGPDAANVSTDIEVRKAGLKRLGAKAGKIAAAGAGIAGLGMSLNYGLEHSDMYGKDRDTHTVEQTDAKSHQITVEQQGDTQPVNIVVTPEQK